MTCDLCKYGEEREPGTIYCSKYDVDMIEYAWSGCEGFEYEEGLEC